MHLSRHDALSLLLLLTISLQCRVQPTQLQLGISLFPGFPLCLLWLTLPLILVLLVISLPPLGGNEKTANALGLPL